MRQSTFHGIWVPIITPFNKGLVDHVALARLGRHLADQGISGLVVGATTGEGASMDDDEKQAAFQTLRDALGPDYPLVLSICESETLKAIQIARDPARLRPTGLLVTAPPYVRPSQTGLCRHFENIADAAAAPVIIYNIPYRTGVDIELETLQTLSHHPRIVAVKECGAGPDRLMSMIHDLPLQVLIGDDSQFFAGLCLGADGAVAASAHLRPDLWVRIYEQLKAGKLIESRQLAHSLQPLIRALSLNPNPAPVKAVLAATGMIGPELRLPLTQATQGCISQTQLCLEALNGI